MSLDEIFRMPPDTRSQKPRQFWTTDEHLMQLEEGQRAIGAITAAGLSAVSGQLGQIDDHVVEQIRQEEETRWAIEAGFDHLAGEVSGLRDDVRNGFEGMRHVFSWGLARLCWEHEQDRQMYQQVLDVLKHPLETRALEHRERAEFCYANEYWEEAVREYAHAVEANPYDYLAHARLGEICWFRAWQWDPSMEHFALAAKYADVKDANANARYYGSIAYAHVAFLWRIDALAREDGEESLVKAVKASRRAVELKADLAVAVLEHVIDLFAVSDAEGAVRAMDAAVAIDEDLLLLFESNPDLMHRAEVQSFAASYRSRYAAPAREARDLKAECHRLIAATVPRTPLFAEAATPLDRDLTGRGECPRRSLEEGLASLTERLVAGRHQADREWQEVSGILATERERLWQTNAAADAANTAARAAARETPTEALLTWKGYYGLLCLCILPIAIALGIRGAVGPDLIRNGGAMIVSLFFVGPWIPIAALRAVHVVRWHSELWSAHRLRVSQASSRAQELTRQADDGRRLVIGLEDRLAQLGRSIALYEEKQTDLSLRIARTAEAVTCAGPPGR